MSGKDELHITPVILSGGAGSRLWPLSSDDKPKQFHAVHGTKSMFAQTLERVLPGPDIHFDAPLIVCGAAHEALARQTCIDVGITTPRFVLEPLPRNTAPALAAMAYAQSLIDPDSLVLVLPADHIITKPEILRDACLRAAAAARAGMIITFGIVPSHPETGYGYIKQGTQFDGAVSHVERFAEKPDSETAKSYISSGDYVWNAGIFYFQCSAFLKELQTHAPDVLLQAKCAVDQGQRTGDTLLLDAGSFAKAPSISVDYAVMERTQHAGIVPVDMGWNDVGSFATLHEIGDKDEHGNAVTGPAALFDANNNLVISTGLAVSVIGLSGIMVIATPTGLLVAPMDRAQDVRLAANAFKAK
jgi:mannose-1-phosphate guanylyltransferase / mannose-6-phosphate isomerase